MNPIIEVNNFRFRFSQSEKELLKGINFILHPGKSLALVGLSGSGKTTLCHCISGIYPLIRKGNLEGTIKIFNKPVVDYRMSELSQKVGVVFQNPDTQLFLPTVEDEIAFGPENLGWKPERIRKRIEEVCRKIGIESLRYKNPKELSGGQKQLVTIAATLSLGPEIIIFDEAMSQLDEKGTAMVKELINRLKKEGKTVVMIEHNPEHFHLADEVKLLLKGELVEYKGWM